MATGANYDIKLITKAARLYYFENLNQNEIAEKLNISRSKVSRCLTRARDKKIVEIKINSPDEKFEELEGAMENKFNLKNCVVVPSSESFKETCRNISVVLSKMLDRLLKNGDYLGVGWGMTLKTVSSLIEPSRKININIVPLIGGMGKSGIEVHTNSVASTLAEKYGGRSYAIHSPAVLDSEQARIILEKDSNITEIFNMTDRIDTAIVGMSDIGRDSTMIKSGNFSVEDFKNLQSLGVEGDVNLIFIDRKGNPVESEIDKRILKASPGKLKNIKNVIGLAFGSKKIEVIKAALKGKIISSLITDENTARSIVR
jgi:DNA-binding transcriptional regulator LsrR (DeoR family)